MSDLRELAEAARDDHLLPYFHGMDLNAEDVGVPCAEYIAAANPTAILALLDRLDNVRTYAQQRIDDGDPDIGWDSIVKLAGRAK